MNRRALLSRVLACALAGSLPAAAASAADTEVEALLQFVGASGCSFNRNGTTHDSAEAEAHLRRKYAYAENRIGSAEEFIDRLATRSSMTRREYSVSCPDGRTLSSADWLYAQLRALRTAS